MSENPSRAAVKGVAGCRASIYVALAEMVDAPLLSLDQALSRVPGLPIEVVTL